MWSRAKQFEAKTPARRENCCLKSAGLPPYSDVIQIWTKRKLNMADHDAHLHEVLDGVDFVADCLELSKPTLVGCDRLSEANTS